MGKGQLGRDGAETEDPVPGTALGGSVFDTLMSRDPQRALARLSSDYTRHRMQAEAQGFDFLHMSARIPRAVSTSCATARRWKSGPIPLPISTCWKCL